MYDFIPILARLKAVKKAANLTNDELAAKANVPVGTVNKILSGDTKEPKLPAFMSIASALGTSVDYLVYGTTPSSPSELKKDEKDLIDYYRDASEDSREDAVLILRRSAERNKRNAQNAG